MPNPQNIITAPKQDLRSEFKGEEPKMPQPSNINTPPIYILSNEIKKNLNPQSQEK
jgi:hypothetical protein